VPRLDRDHHGLAELREGLGEAPHLDHRQHAHLVPQVAQRAVPLGRLHQVDVGAVLGAGGGGRHPLAADLGDAVHVALRRLHRLGALVVVVDDPLGEADGAFDRHAVVGDPLGQVLERTALVDEGVDLADPRLDGAVAGLGGDVDLLGDGEVVAADRAGVEAVAERLVGGGVLLGGHGLLQEWDGGQRRRRGDRGAQGAAARQQVPSGQRGLHARKAPCCRVSVSDLTG
jgi:hypothetical protein